LMITAFEFLLILWSLAHHETVSIGSWLGGDGVRGASENGHPKVQVLGAQEHTLQ